MVKEIVKDINILQQKSDRFEFTNISNLTMNVGDEHLIQDLLDTAEYHKNNCLGLACIQIGVPKRVVVVRMGNKFVPFINPTILQKSKDTYLIKEGCLSLDEQREARRHYHIKVGYTTQNKKVKVETFKGITAQIIQHEIDHLNGILI